MGKRLRRVNRRVVREERELGVLHISNLLPSPYWFDYIHRQTAPKKKVTGSQTKPKQNMYVFNVHLQRIFSNYISRQNTNDNIHLTQYDFIFSLLSYYTDLFHNIGLSRHSRRVLLPLLHLLSPSKRVRQVHPLLPPPDKSLVNVFLKHSIKRKRMFDWLSEWEREWEREKGNWETFLHALVALVS